MEPVFITMGAEGSKKGAGLIRVKRGHSGHCPLTSLSIKATVCLFSISKLVSANGAYRTSAGPCLSSHKIVNKF